MPESDRIFFELTQLYKGMNAPLNKRLALYKNEEKTVFRRDDCTLQYSVLSTMAGDMENNDLTTERTFEQIYSFIAPHFRAELTEGAGKETAVL